MDLKCIFSTIDNVFVLFIFPGCGIWQFTCGSGDCIAGYDVCDGIPQCADSSDESLENCPSKVAWFLFILLRLFNLSKYIISATTAKIKPTRPPAVISPKKAPQNVRPQSLNKYGREGEKMNPNFPANPQNPPPQQQQPSAFQHRGMNGVQIPYPNVDSRYI